MISIPLELGSPGVSTTLTDDLGEYDDTKWRILEWDGSDFVDVNFFDFILGKSYFMLVSSQNEVVGDNGTLDTGAGTTPQVDSYSPFGMNISPGWYQLGNPYDFNISWSEILSWNGITNEIDPDLWVFNGTYNSTDILPRFGGGFIFVNSDVYIEFPATYNPANGRTVDIKPLELVKNPIDGSHWEVMINAARGGKVFPYGGIGMHPEALQEKDAFDKALLPSLGNDIRLRFNHKESLAKYFMKDMVSSSANHTWEFTVSSDIKGDETILSWDNSYFGNSSKSLMLMDLTDGRLIDMSEINSYSYAGNMDRNFKVFYGDESFIQQNALPGQLISRVYPNLFSDNTHIEIALPDSESDYQVSVQVVNTLGQEVIVLANGRMNAGFHTLDWNGTDMNGYKLPSGVYMFNVRVEGIEYKQQTSGRLMIK